MGGTSDIEEQARAESTPDRTPVLDLDALLAPAYMTPEQVSDLVERVRANSVDACAARGRAGARATTTLRREKRSLRGDVAAKLSRDTGKHLRRAAIECGVSYGAACQAWRRLYGSSPWPGYQGHGGHRGRP